MRKCLRRITATCTTHGIIARTATCTGIGTGQSTTGTGASIAYEQRRQREDEV